MRLSTAAVCHTRSPAITKKSRPYHLRPKPSLWFPVMDRKWNCQRSKIVPCTLC